MQDRLQRDVELFARPRFPGSHGAIEFRQKLTSRIRDVGLDPVEVPFRRKIGDSFIHFTNVLGMPLESVRVLLVAHADSLCNYQGAIDAATCMASMLEILQYVGNRHVMLAFVDGEEAYPPFKWSIETAMSGSQHLVPWLMRRGIRPDLVVVLDLWGGPITSTFTVPRNVSPVSVRDYTLLSRIDERLYPDKPSLFTLRTRSMQTQDDSWSFHQQSGWFPRVVDLIATPFPPQWHDLERDTPSQVDYPVLVRSTLILAVYVYLHSRQ